VRVGELAGETWPGADLVAEVPILCSPVGQAWLKDRIAKDGVRRVVAVGCSPREHEHTFRRVLAEAGADPWQLQMVNVREQGEWAGGPPDDATARARALVRAALSRVGWHRALPVREVEVSGDAVVVGGGAAGVSAALAIARRGRRVLLVEREHALGGHVNLLDEVFPGMECASCFLEPALDEVLHHPNVEVLTGAEVEDVQGSNGNFTVRVSVRPRRVDRSACLGCGGCAALCPVEVPSPGGLGAARAVGIPYPGALPNAAAVDEACLSLRGGACTACADACPVGAIHLDEAPSERVFRCGAVVLATGLAPPGAPGPSDVLSAWQLERMTHPNGPTGGALACADGRPPRSVLLAPATGADDQLWPDELAKLALVLREKHPGVEVAVAGGLDGSPALARPARALARAGVRLLPGTARAAPAAGRGAVAELSTGESVETDLLVLWETPRPSPGASALARRLRIAERPDGFLEDRASPFAPTASRAAGIFVAGAAGGPRTVFEAIRDGAAAAGQVLSTLEPGARLVLEPLAAEVDEGRCGACGVCGSVCPYGAVGLSRELGVSRVEPSFCHGCGSCAAACPSGAISAPHFTRRQIAAELSGLLRAEPPEERE